MTSAHLALVHSLEFARDLACQLANDLELVRAEVRRLERELEMETENAARD